MKQFYVIFPYQIENNKAIPMDEEFIKENYELGYNYLKQHEEILRGREKGKMDKDGWFLYVYPKNLVTSNIPKMVSPDITFGLQVTKDNTGICVKNGAYGISIKENITIDDNVLLAILNSNLLWFFLKTNWKRIKRRIFQV